MSKAFGHFYANYVNFKGRTTRSTYWLFVLDFVIIQAIIAGAFWFVSDLYKVAAVGQIILLGFSAVLMLASIIPGIAMQVRRLHDVGKKGYWCFFNLLPVIGQIVLLIFTIMPSGPDNEWGEMEFIQQS